MSNTIDQRVVEMQFDNRNFERNVSTTMSTLDKLKQSLKLSGASKGFEDISAAANGVNMSGLGSAVESVQAKFSALSVIGVTALANITNSAINTGKQLIKSLSIDQITAGWTKFGDKTKSVATLVAQGNAIEDVNAQLDRLNWFTDETSYNFTEMVSNIAKFTATGKGLEESVTAMEGIANWAAVSGQNAQTASNAMYQLSQAMGAGVMRKEDYKSIQNASMDTDEFRQKCLDAAVALGTLKKNADGTYKSLMQDVKDGDFTKAQFAEHLTQDAWLTSDVMMKVFNEYSSAVNAIYEVTEEKGMLASEVLDQVHTRADELKTGVMTDEEAINAAIKDLGYVAEDGALLFDAFGIKAFEAAQKARTWGDAVDSVKDAVSTGWMNTFEIIFGNSEEATELWTDLANSMWDVFASGGEARNEMLKGWKELGGRDNLIEGFWNVWEGFFGDGDKYLGLLGSIKEAFREVFPPMTSERLASITEGFKNLTEKLKPSSETLDKLKRAFKGVFSIFDIGKKAISAILKPIGQLFGSEGFGSLGDFILTTAANIGDFFTALNEGFETTKISEVLSKITSGISDFLKGIFDGLGGFSGIFSSIGNTICKVASKIWGAVTKVFGWIKENISAGDIFAGLAGGGIFVAAKKFSGLVDKIKDIFSNMFDKKEKTDGIKAKITDILDSVHDSLESFTSGIKVASLVGIAAAVTLLSSAFKKISELDGAGIAKSLLAIGVSLAMMVKALNLMPKNKAFATDFFGMSESTNLIKSGAAMVLMAASIKILADAITKLSELSLKEISKGLIAVGGGMTILSLGLKALNDVKIPLRTSIAMLALAESCKILGDAFTKFSGFSWSEIARGLVAMGGALGELVAAMAILEKFGGFSDIFGSLGILITVKSLGELAESLQSFGAMKWDEIGRGLTAMGGALAELTIVLAALSKISTISLGGSASGGIIGVFSNKLFGKGGASVNGSGSFSAQISGLSNIFSAGAIWVVIQGLSKLADSLSSFGSMSWGEIARGLAGMGGALAEVGGVAGALGKIAGFSSILGSGAILITIQSLADLASAFKSFGGMSWDEINRGLIGMGGALAEVTLMSGALGTFAGFAGILGSGAILIAVQGLADLASAFKSFGGMSWGEIARGFVGMGGALVEVGVITGALGYLTNFAGILGAGTIWIAVQGLDDLANALKKFGEMNWGEIGRGLAAMGGALTELAVGSLLNTLSGLGALSIKTIAEPLGTLADSMKKWSGVTIPLGLGFQLTALAAGVQAFTFGGLGALTIIGISESLGVLADSVRNWSDVSIPEGLSDNLASLAEGVLAFTFDGLGAASIATVAEPLGTLADSVKAWNGVTVPSGLGDQLSSLAAGIRAFSFAFLGGWSIDAVAKPLGTLAGSVKAWNGVTVPSGLGEQLTSLAAGVRSFSFAFLGGWSIDAVAGPLRSLATSVKAWKGVSVPSGLGEQLMSLAEGVEAFSFTFIGGWSIGAVDGPLKELAGAVKEWSGVTVPSGLEDDLVSLAKGVAAFTLDGLGASVISGVTEPLENMADSIKAWDGVSAPSGMQEDLESLAAGIRSFTLDGLGASAISEVADPLGTMADSIKNWSDVTIPEGIGDKLETIAKGVKEFTFKGNGASAINEVAEPLGVLADSISKWSGVKVPEGLGDKLESIGKGITALNIEGNGADAITNVSGSLGDLADSIAKWQGVTIPDDLGDKLESLGKGIAAFSFEGADNNALTTTAPAVGVLADSIAQWSGVSVPDNLGSQLETLATGVEAFSFEGADNNALAAAAPAIGTLAASIKKWSDVSIPKTLGDQLANLATGVEAFSFEGADNNALATTAPAIGTLATSIKQWSDVTIPETLGNQLTNLATGIEAFSFDGAGDSASALTTVAPSIGVLADSIKQWQGVTVPDDLGSQLESLASGISAFNFDEGANNLLTTVAPSIGTLADSIKNWSDVAVPENLGTQLESLGKGVAAFSFEGADANALSTTAPAIGVLADSIAKWTKLTIPETLTGDQLTNLAKGIAAFSFEGAENNTLATVAPVIGVLADSVKKWSNLTIPETLTGDQLTNLAKGIAAFSFEGAENNTLATVAPSIGVLADSVAKWTKLTIPETLTGDQLTNLAKGIEAFTFDEAGNNTFTTVAPAIGTLADSIAKWTKLTIPETLTGDQLTNLAKGIEAFVFDGTLSLDASATGIGNMADSIAKWKNVTIPESLTGGQLTSLAKGIEAFIFTGSLSLDSAAAGIGNLADSIAKWKYVKIPESLSGDLQNLAKGVGAFEGMSAKSSGITAIENIYSAASNLSGVKFSTITSGLSDLAKSLTDFGSVGSAISGVGQAITDNLITPIQNAIPALSSIGSEIATTIASGFTSASATVSAAGVSLVANAAKAARSKTGAFKSAGSALASALGSGIRGNSGSASSAGGSIASSGASGARSKYSSFHGAGQHLGSGLIAGINSKKQDVYNAGYNLGKAAADGVNEGEQAASPSKLAIKSGKWLGEGFIIGMQRMSQSVYNSGENMGETAVNATTNAMTDMLSALNSDIDAQPTIKPVVDLTDVKAGANAISGMFDSGPSVGVMSNIKAISSSMNRRSQNGTNGEVVSAINRLRDKLDNIGNTSYTINGVTYDDGSAVSDAIETLVRYAKIEGRV